MSTTALTKLFDLLTSTLSTSDMIWLINEMKEYVSDSETQPKPYTIEELRARIAQSERDSAEGRVYDFDDVMSEIEEEFAREEELEMAAAI